jgi:ring-1,2-phenylacetyl-CoA epoxidase subunit PaaC
MKAGTDWALSDAVLGLADDEMILAQRISEWTGHAPILEEDIAFANLALDELGHAQLWYGLVADLRQEHREEYPDRLVFQRPPADYRNVQLVELPCGDWAFTMLRQYLFDALERVRLKALVKGGEARLRPVAAKIEREEAYHLRHTSAWVLRLGLGTEESRRRMQSALVAIWPYTGQLFGALPGEEPEKALPAAIPLREEWEDLVLPHLAAAGLEIRLESAPVSAGRDLHTSHLEPLLNEMQQVARLAPEAKW